MKDKILQIGNYLFADDYPKINELWNSLEIKDNEFSNIEVLRKHSASLTAIFYLIESIQSRYNKTETEDMLLIIQSNRSVILNILHRFAEYDLKNNITEDELIDELLKSNSTEVGTSLLYHRLREAISMNKFIPNEDDILTYKVLDNKEIVTHVAHIDVEVDKNMVITNGVNKQWKELMTKAISEMDDYTADTFDVMSLMWLNQAKDKNDMVHFSHEDVLRMRQLQKQKGGKGSESFRKRDRAEVMIRIANIASIWIQQSDEYTDESREFDLSNQKRLFHIDNVTFAKDHITKEPIGIYECDIRPGDILAEYLYGSGKQTGLLPLQAFRYNPNKQKHHKRLTRYLSWQWKIRSPKEKPFNINGLLKAMGINTDEKVKRPGDVYENFENILDTLTEDGIIGGWEYTEPLDSSKMTGRGWIYNYWIKQQVVLRLPEYLRKEFSQKKNPNGSLDYSEIQSLVKSFEVDGNAADLLLLPLQTELEVTPETVLEVRKKRGLNLNQASKEIGISYTTLSRYERRLIKKPNKNNDEKLRNWLNK